MAAPKNKKDVIKDIIESATPEEKNEIFNYLMGDLFNAVTEDDVFQISGKNIYLNGQVLGPKEKLSVAASAQTIHRSLFFRQLLKEMKMVANRRMYSKAENYEDMVGGKWILYTIDVLEKKIFNLAQS